MQSNPAYGIPTEISERVRHGPTDLTTVREQTCDRERVQRNTKIRRALSTLSVIALILSVIALMVALVCFILIFTERREDNSNVMITTSNPWQFSTTDPPSVGGNLIKDIINLLLLSMFVINTSS